ncbi:MAG: hypothetical protein IJG60_00490 [Thermoguttaceae bacterium]|nr:hypothetical protein [Thermoguttaceae bacterium]
MATRFFTNEGNNTLLNKFKGIFENHENIDYFDALVGYFYSSGYFAIRPFLDKVPHVRILVGINADHIIAKYNEKGLLWKGDDEETVKEALSVFQKDIATCGYSAEIENGIKLFVEDVATGKIEIRAHKTGKLHAKIYIFRPKKWNEHNSGYVITGSSNLTEAGLGASSISNYEFNVQLQEYEDVEFAKSEFEKLWNEAAEIRPVEIETLKTTTHLNDQVTPFEIYIKMLISYFGRNIDYSTDGIDLPRNYKQLSYQIDAVNQGYEKLCRYNGFFLADVVGLGKTVVALLIAKKFFYGNGYPDHISKILIICPPALKEVWENTVDDFGLKSCKIITNGSIHKEERRFNTYDLVIVDEAHKFRNQKTDGYDDLQRLCLSPSSVGSTLGKAPDRKKVILISATPQNNGPADIRSLTYLFQIPRDTDLDLPNLEDFFNPLIRRYDTTKKLDNKEAKKEIRKINKELRDNIIFPLTVRRTRTDLMNNDAYKIDLAKQHIFFPESRTPVQMLYKLNNNLEQLFDKTLECLSKRLNYSRYMVLAYLKPEFQQKYKKNVAVNASIQLAGMMKNILIKRLDSSFFAFKLSLKRFLDSVYALLKMLDDNCVYVLNKVNVTSLVLNGEDDKLQEIFEKKEDAEKFTTDNFESNFRELLSQDKEVLEELWTEWENVHDDPKYDKFLDSLKSRLLSKKENPSGKVVVFSESEDTTNYLENRLRHDGFTRLITVSASNRNSMREKIAENFDANYERELQKNDYDIIVCTEVLAEGINLHRAGLIVNYDTPWNSTRLMQRIGRINRIGSSNKFISIYNFFPTAEVNDTINLEKTAKRKLLAFHHALGNDSQIYSPDDEKAESFGLFSTNPTEEQDQQLAILLWLRKFVEENPEDYKRIKDLPLKIRTGRAENPEAKEKFPAESTVAYLKNTKRDVFFAVSADKEPEVISFLEAEKLLKCQVDEPRLSIPDSHYKHVKQFLESFEKQLEDDASKRQVSSRSLTIQEKQAIKYLRGMLRENIVNDKEKALFNNAIDLINKKTYTNLYKEINKVFKSNLKPIECLPKLLEIIQKYVGRGNEAEDNQRRETIDSVGSPNIVISETFVNLNL